MIRGTFSITLVCAALALAVVSGCVTSPTDRSEVGSPARPISFDGYYPTSATAVIVESEDPATGTFTRIASTTTQSTPYRALGTDWYHWQASVVVPPQFWRPGSQGSLAVLRATAEGRPLFGLEENWGACFGQHGSEGAARFEQKCATGQTVTVCTADYLPFSTRRSPCPARALVGVRSGGEDFWPLPETTTTIVPDGAPSTIRWRGDSVSFVDVFDAAPDSEGLPSLTGVNVVRIFYPQSRDSNAEIAFDPNALAASLGVTDPRQLPWRGIRAMRQYDVGECSAFQSWRAILNSLIPVLETAIREVTIRGQTVTVTPLSRTALRPILRPDGNDAIAFAQGFALRAGGVSAGRLYLRTAVRLGAVEGRITAIVEDANTTVDYQPSAGFHIAAAFTGASEAGVEESIRRQLSTLIPGSIQSAIPVSVRPLPIMERVVLRPDGIEFVLAEDRRDEFYRLIADQGYCTRTPITNTAPMTGLLFTLFDPPIRSDPRVLGDRF